MPNRLLSLLIFLLFSFACTFQTIKADKQPSTFPSPARLLIPALFFADAKSSQRQWMFPGPLCSLARLYHPMSNPLEGKEGEENHLWRKGSGGVDLIFYIIFSPFAFTLSHNSTFPSHKLFPPQT